MPVAAAAMLTAVLCILPIRHGKPLVTLGQRPQDLPEQPQTHILPLATRLHAQTPPRTTAFRRRSAFAIHSTHDNDNDADILISDAGSESGARDVSPPRAPIAASPTPTVHSSARSPFVADGGTQAVAREILGYTPDAQVERWRLRLLM